MPIKGYERIVYNIAIKIHVAFLSIWTGLGTKQAELEMYCSLGTNISELE